MSGVERSAAVRAHFQAQAAACERLGSPFTARLTRLLGERLTLDDPIGAYVLGWSGDPEADALALRLAGALNGLALSGDPRLAAIYPPAGDPDPETLWRAVDATLRAEPDAIAAWLASPPQTNETARAAALLPALGAIAARFERPLALYEIGSSAGLILQLDRFFYDFDVWRWGDPTSGVRLAPEIRGDPPPAPAPFDVIDRRGCDRAPIDPGDPAAALRLRAYCWPDQRARVDRLTAAMALATEAGLSVAAAEAADWVEASLPPLRTDAVRVLLHTIVWQYLPEEQQTRIAHAMEAAGAAATADAPLAWLRLEPDVGLGAVALRVTLWPGGTTEILAEADAHGRWLRWGAAD